MSTALLSALPATRDPPSIAPHLLHSPAHSPLLDIQHIMPSYRDTAPNSQHPLYFHSTPTQHEAPPPIPAPITSPSGMLIVHSYGPSCGPPGVTLSAQVDFRNLSTPNVRLRIVFGDLALPTSVASTASSSNRAPGFDQQQYGDWNLEITVPPAGQASAHMAEVRSDGRFEWPLTLQALDAGGNLLDTIGFGFFIYEDHIISTKSSPASSPTHRSRSRSPNKRTRQEEERHSPPATAKRPAVGTEAMNLRRMSVSSADVAYVNTQRDTTSNQVFNEGPSPAPSQTLPPGMTLHPHIYQHPLQLQTTALSHHMPQEVFTVQPVPDEYSDDSPALVRTTQLVSNGERLAGAKASQASVAVQGNLDAMKDRWSDAERAAKRRLVQFWKRQVGTTLHISFDAIPQHQYTENTIVVSCIYRDVIDEYYITSVDVIYLLEALAGSRFEVEEKNRIRRNLEGFKPMTVSKSKPGTEEFFRTIMEFAAPKPRNIEKDVKVFEWGKIKMMLEKVFSKYSTVPLSPSGSSPQYEGTAPGSSGAVYPVVRDTTNEATQSRITRSRSPKTRKKRSPAPVTSVQTSHPQARLVASNDTGHAYTAETFSPSKYEETLEFHTPIDPCEYDFGEMRFLGMPSEFDAGMFKVDMTPAGEGGNANKNGDGSGVETLQPPGPSTAGRLQRFKSSASTALPPDSTPAGMSFSSTSSASGLADSQDAAGLTIHEQEHPSLSQHL